MNCPRCQQSVRDGARFCDHCGSSMESAAAADHTPGLLADTVRDPLIGHVIDSKYQLTEQIGAGGMGVVYRAERVLVGDEVALKILRGEFVAEDETVERFRREARAAARLRHPNVVAIYDYGEARGADAPAYIVMELLDGESLRALLRREGRLQPDRAVRLMRGICSGIGSAHRRQIVHRDIKPDNIILLPPDEEEGREEETVKVVDFGIAKLRDAATGGTLTRKGFQPGTIFYMSPEQCRGDQLDARSDVYSLGAMLYEMLSGTPPFVAETHTGVVAKHLFDPPPPFPKGLRIPASLEHIVMRALSKEPVERPPDALALARELQEAWAKERESWEARPAQEEPQRPEPAAKTLPLPNGPDPGKPVAVPVHKPEAGPAPTRPALTKPAVKVPDVNPVPAPRPEEPEARAGLDAGKIFIALGLLAALAMAVWVSFKLFGSDSSADTAQNSAGSSAQSSTQATQTNTGGPIYKPAGDPYRVKLDRFKVALSPDGESLIYTSPPATSTEPKFPTNLFDLEGTSVAFSPDGRLVALGQDDGQIILKNSSDFLHRQEWSEHKDYVFIVAFTPDGSRLLSAGADKTVRVWNLSSGRQERQMNIYENELIVTLDPARQRAAVLNPPGGFGGWIYIRQIDGSGTDITIRDRRADISSGAFSPNGEALALGTTDGRVQMWSLPDGTFMREIQGPARGEVGSVAFSPDGKYLAVGWNSGDIELRLAGDGTSAQTLKGHTRVVRSLSFSRDGRALASGAEDRTIRLWRY